MDQEAIDRRPNAAYCRALYDYKAADTSSLSFRKNDILEVVNRLESGWWDGFLGELRGWFPSNYVAVISDEEIEVLLAQTPLQMQATPSSYGTETAATTNGIMEEGSPSEDKWLHGDMDQSTSRNGLPEPSTSLDPEAETSDFWLPEVTPDGQVIVECLYCL
jgi:son of sevenless-like protein